VEQIAAMAHQQVAADEQEHGVQCGFDRACDTFGLGCPRHTDQRPTREQQEGDENRLADQLLQRARPQAQGNQRWNAEQAIEQFMVLATPWQKEQGAQKQQQT
jgi:hypothetical protein